MKSGSGGQGTAAIEALYRGLGLLTAAFLLTEQLKISGVFLSSGAFSLSLSGPVTGYQMFGVTEEANQWMYGMNVITAFLLILDELQVIGTYITSGRFSVVVSGPLFGGIRMGVYLPETQEFFHDYQDILLKYYLNQNGGRR
ncbi:hypothetical protein ACOJUR_02325 [Alicyclobacillus tolerans]|uniref:Uncharacterized protein n=2 Tax=Alicyclobacillus tolerans TaxID=90970 RepID=A0A1M6R7M4_9BACL|nr:MULTISPECIES: hypothetical protein [Alicyclobacillus]MDP9729484.1 hypothetical protein [Alicyclobacillus tengchongensis]QRF22401.1 hypothetical protein FY534_00930 [Alicyclobacillus sp. TC]SHK28452.1 hypothetical protein SAMN05443507_11180 [Alicyclobacillus montanus]